MAEIILEKNVRRWTRHLRQVKDERRRGTIAFLSNYCVSKLLTNTNYIFDRFKQ